MGKFFRKLTENRPKMKAWKRVVAFFVSD